MGNLTMLNESGDTTISWSADRDEEMEQIIKKKMEEGVTFFVVERRGRQPAQPKRGAKLEAAEAAMKQRTLVIPDEDLAKFVSTGAATVERSSDAKIENSRVSRDPKEAGDVLGAQFTFASVEPMLERIRPRAGLLPDWVIVGGESGREPRKMHPDWARYMRDDCAKAGIPFFMKQMTGKAPIPDDLLVRQFPKTQQPGDHQ